MSIGWVRAFLFSAVVGWSIPALAASVSITQQPQSQTVRQGSNVTFTVTATGTLPLSYQWVFNATNNLSAATNSSLTLTNVQPANQGGYSVRVGDVSGSVTSQVATLTVLVLPVIVVQPQSLTVVEGEDATFSVAVTNDATLPVNYQAQIVNAPDQPELHYPQDHAQEVSGSEARFNDPAGIAVGDSDGDGFRQSSSVG